MKSVVNANCNVGRRIHDTYRNFEEKYENDIPIPLKGHWNKMKSNKSVSIIPPLKIIWMKNNYQYHEYKA
jgi:hypothetical protein